MDAVSHSLTDGATKITVSQTTDVCHVPDQHTATVTNDDNQSLSSHTFLNGTDIVLKRCELDKCCQFKVHCPFCDLKHFKPSLPARVRDHLNRSHFQHAVYLQGLMVVKCFHQCTHPAGHYHCPLCEKEILKRVAFTNHLISHVQKLGFNSSVVQAPHPKQPDRVRYGGKIIQLCQNKCKESKGKHYHCPLCGRETFKDLPLFIGHIWRCQEGGPRQRQVLGSGETLKDLLNPKLVDHITPPSEVPDFKWHRSIVRNLSDLPLSRCQDPRCCDGRYHCPLCPVIKLKPNYVGYMQSHLLSHLRSGVMFKDYYILICYSSCLKSQQECSEADQSRNRRKFMSAFSFHFHCPLCGKTCIRKQHFVKHLKLCWAGRSKVHSIAAGTVCGNERTSDDIDDCIDLDTACLEDDEKEYPLDLVRIVADCEASCSKGQDHSYSLDHTGPLTPQEPQIRSHDNENPTPISCVSRTANENVGVQNVIVDGDLSVNGEVSGDGASKSSEQNNEVFSDVYVDRLRAEQQMYVSQPGSDADQMIEDVSGATGQPTECATYNNSPTQLVVLQNCVEDSSNYDAGVEDSFYMNGSNCYQEAVQINDDRSKQAHRNHAENINNDVPLEPNGLYAESDSITHIEKATLLKDPENDIILESPTISKPAKIVQPPREVKVTSDACVSAETNGAHSEATDCARTNISMDKIVRSPGSDAEATPAVHSKTDSTFLCQQLRRKRKRLTAKPEEEEIDNFPCRKKKMMISPEERVCGIESGSTVVSSDTLARNSSSDDAVEKRQKRSTRGNMTKEPGLAQSSCTSVGNKSPDIMQTSVASQAATSHSERGRYTTRGVKLNFSALSSCRNSQAMSRDEQNVDVSFADQMSEKKRARKMPQNKSHLKENDIVSDYEGKHESICDKSKSDECIVNENCMSIKHSAIKMKPAEKGEINHSASLELVSANHADDNTQSCGYIEDGRDSCAVSEVDNEQEVSASNDKGGDENFVREVRNMCRKVSKQTKDTPEKDSQNLKLWSSDNLSEELRNLGVNTTFFPKIVTFDDTLRPGKRPGQFSVRIPTKAQVSVSTNTDVCEDSDIEMFEPRGVNEVHSDVAKYTEPQTTSEIAKSTDQSRQDLETNGNHACKDIPDSAPHSERFTSVKVSQKNPSTSTVQVSRKEPSAVNSSDVGKNFWKCYLCDYLSVHFADLTMHLSAYHGSLPITCDICEELFYRIRDLQAHLRLKHGPQPHVKSLTCRHCRKTFAVQSQLDFHMRQSHASEDNRPRLRARLVCCVCDHVAQSQLEMNVHRLEHKREDLICKFCGKQFIKLVYLQTHIEAVHTKITSSSCPQCGKFFSHTKYLAHHMKRHTGIKKHVCPICGWRFYERNTLRAHMETHKPRDQRKYAFICSYCGARYCNRTNFKDHLNKHTGNRPHVCHLCDKRFAYRSMLGRHRLYTHSTNRPFMCPTCPKGFRLQSKLDEHLASHAGISSHVCSSCSKGFSTRASLRQHFKRCKAEDFWLSQSTQSGNHQLLPNVTEHFSLDNPSPAIPEEHTLKMGSSADSRFIGFYPNISQPPEQLSRSQPVNLAMVDPNGLTTISDVDSVQQQETMFMTAGGCMAVPPRHGDLSGLPSGDRGVCTTPSVISQDAVAPPLKWHVSELPGIPHYTSSGHTVVQFMDGPATPSDCATDVSYDPAPKTSDTSVLDFMVSTDDVAIPVYTKDYYVCSACNTTFEALDLAQAHILTCQASAVTSPEPDLSVLKQQGVSSNPGKSDDGFLIEPFLSNAIGNIEPQSCHSAASLLEPHSDTGMAMAGSSSNAEQVFIVRDNTTTDTIPASDLSISSQAGTRVVQIFEGDTDKFQEYHILSDKSEAKIMELVESLARNKQRGTVQILIPDSELGHKS